jgi:antitoxin Phd
MRTLQLREAKATLSAVVDAAERGEPTMITRHGRPAAVVVAVSDARAFFEKRKPSFASLLLAIPGELEIERDQTPVREAEL